LAILSAGLVNQALSSRLIPPASRASDAMRATTAWFFLSTHGVPKAGTPIPRAECHPSLACGPARRFAEKAADGIPFVTADRAAPADSHKARDRAMSGPPGGPGTSTAWPATMWSVRRQRDRGQCHGSGRSRRWFDKLNAKKCSDPSAMIGHGWGHRGHRGHRVSRFDRAAAPRPDIPRKPFALPPRRSPSERRSQNPTFRRPAVA
jgi:hypothetical protein